MDLKANVSTRSLDLWRTDLVMSVDMNRHNQDMIKPYHTAANGKGVFFRYFRK